MNIVPNDGEQLREEVHERYRRTALQVLGGANLKSPLAVAQVLAAAGRAVVAVVVRAIVIPLPERKRPIGICSMKQASPISKLRSHGAIL